MSEVRQSDNLNTCATEFDAGLFEHRPGARYLHLLREVLLTYRESLRRISEATGVSGAQFELLRELCLAGGRSTTSRLARELGVDPAAVTRLVAALEQQDLVVREDDASDRRRRPVVFTPAGRQLAFRMHEELHAREEELEAHLDAGSIETTAEVLRTIRSLLDPGAGRRRI